MSVLINLYEISELNEQLRTIVINNFDQIIKLRKKISKPGLGNVRPGGQMRPVKHLYVANELQFKLFKQLILHQFHVKNMLYHKSDLKKIIFIISIL